MRRMMGASAISLVRLRSAAWAAELTGLCLGKGKTNSADTAPGRRDWAVILTKNARLPEVLAC
jgi:hypothetical protein